MKITVNLTQKRIDAYRQQNHSPNIFQDYIMRDLQDSVFNNPVSVFVFINTIYVTLSPNKTHEFHCTPLLRGEIQRYYESRECYPIEFIMDFSSNTIKTIIT